MSAIDEERGGMAGVAASFKCPDCDGRLRQPDPDLSAYECTRCSGVVEETARGRA